MIDQQAYWKSRVAGQIDLGVVGLRSLGREYNEYIYRRRLEVITAVIRDSKKPISKLRVLDIGCGSGFYVEFWRNLGVGDLVGLDVSADSVALMTARYPDFTFHAMDATDSAAFEGIEGKFDIITIFDVMYHIIDDDSALRLLLNVSGRLSDGGAILLFDHIGRRDYSFVGHVRFRGRETYRSWLNVAGLSLTRRVPLFVFLIPPVCGIKVADYMVSGLYKIAGVFFRLVAPVGRFFGLLFYKIDEIARVAHVRLPNQELLVLSRSLTAGDGLGGI
jgi:SAM-dependent methyltransferase